MEEIFFSKIFRIVHNLIIKTEIHLIISNEFEMIIYFFVQSNLYFINNGQKKNFRKTVFDYFQNQAVRKTIFEKKIFFDFHFLVK